MKIIQINKDHYVIVDNSEITQACYVYKNHENVHGRGIFYLPPDTDFVAFNKEAKDVSVITHSTQPMPHGTVREGQITGVTAISLQEVKELIGEIDVEKKARENASICEDDWENGYNQALEDNKEKKYTEEDINKIRQILVEGAITNMSCSSAVVELDKYIQSLQPKTEWEVELIDGKLKLK